VKQGREAAALLVAAAALLGFPSAAPAYKFWKQLNDKPAGPVSISNTNEIGLERTDDGTLHVLWVNERTDGTEALLHTGIPVAHGNFEIERPDVLMTTNTAAGQGFNDRVDLVPAPNGGLRALFSALFPASPFDGILATSTSADGGVTWTPAAAASATAPADRSPVYAASGIAGATDSTGTATGAWGDSSPTGGGWRVGLTTNGPDNLFSDACCQVDPGVAFDSTTGQGYVAANVQDTAIQVTALDGGATVSAPESASAWTLQRTSITGRIGDDGVYVGYGTGDNMFNARPAIWRVGDSKFILLKNQHDAAHVGITAGPDGRLWIYWDRDDMIYASRTNPSVTKFGKVVSRSVPKAGFDVFKLQGEGSAGPLGLFALAGPAGGDEENWWYREQGAGLTCKVAGNGKVKAGKKVTFLVTDAGDPVQDASFYAFIDGDEVDSGRTNAAGKTRMRIPKDARAEEEKAHGSAPGGYEGCDARFQITR
jgi:hypothetical protein